MPRGPKGEKRPADVIGNAVKVMRYPGEETEELDSAPLRGHWSVRSRAHSRLGAFAT